MHITHVIFDLDGLLLDTEKLYDIAIQKTIDPYKKTYTYELKRQLMGRKYIKAMEILRQELDIMELTADQLAEQSLAILHDMFKTCNVKHGAQKLVTHLASHGIPMCIATGSSSNDFELKTSSHKDLISMMEFVVKSDDPEVRHGKPNPDIFLVAKQRFRSPPANESNCIVFEDAPNGVEAAIAAGMASIMVPDPRLKDLPDATEVIESLDNFVPEKYGLPAYG